MEHYPRRRSQPKGREANEPVGLSDSKPVWNCTYRSTSGDCGDCGHSNPNAAGMPTITQPSLPKLPQLKAPVITLPSAPVITQPGAPVITQPSVPPASPPGAPPPAGSELGTPSLPNAGNHAEPRPDETPCRLRVISTGSLRQRLLTGYTAISLCPRLMFVLHYSC